MIFVEILAIVLLVLYFAALIISYIYKKKHNIPTGECACCHKSAKKMLKEYHKECCCKK